MKRTIVAAALAVVVLAVVAAIVVRRRGGPPARCDATTDAYCSGTDGYLCDVVHGNVMQKVACKGVRGCKTSTTRIDCDFSGDALDDPCPYSDEGLAMCNPARNQKVACRASAIAIEDCRGPKGCFIEDGATHCDHAIAREGDACGSDVVGVGGGYACSVDRNDSLQCRGGKYVLDAHCRGPKACTPGSETEDKKLHCDSSIQEEKDPCDQAQLRHYACSADGKSLLKCDGKLWQLDETCLAAKRCARDADKIGCK